MEIKLNKNDVCVVYIDSAKFQAFQDRILSGQCGDSLRVVAVPHPLFPIAGISVGITYGRFFLTYPNAPFDDATIDYALNQN